MRLTSFATAAILLLSATSAAHAQDVEVTGKALTIDADAGLSAVQKRVDQIQGLARGLHVTAWVDRADATYVPGDAITLYVKPNRDAHITVLNVGASGKISVLFPNQAAPDNRVEAHRVLRIGGGDGGYRLRASGPAGRELIKVIATDRPLDLIAFADTDAAGSFRVLHGNGATVADRLLDRISSAAGAAVATRSATLRIASP